MRPGRGLLALPDRPVLATEGQQRDCSRPSPSPAAQQRESRLDAHLSVIQAVKLVAVSRLRVCNLCCGSYSKPVLPGRAVGRNAAVRMQLSLRQLHDGGGEVQRESSEGGWCQSGLKCV